MDDDEICQDVVEVTDYSSQYGSYNSISYVALNVIGAPEVFPEYGDYSETFSARTYGPWWLQHSISDRNFNTILPKERHVKSQDYVDIQPSSRQVSFSTNITCTQPQSLFLRLTTLGVL